MPLRPRRISDVMGGVHHPSGGGPTARTTLSGFAASRGTALDLTAEGAEEGWTDDDGLDSILRGVARAPDVMPISRFAGTERFSLQRVIGEGSFGIVYEALDRKDGSVLALKALKHTHPESLFRFRREFRTLVDLHHPNLVRLYELLCDAEHWFFTMELIDGLAFSDWARANPRRLRDALAQIVDSLHAVHRAGKIHRDIKPSNVLVEANGRVVLLDFGLATDLDAEGSVLTAGSPLYMSPEQCANSDQGTHSDWYAVGVMLYEALTGRPPFNGSVEQIIQDKQAQAPPPPHRLGNVPRDLSTLCMGLLARDPEDRFDGRAMLQYLVEPGKRPLPLAPHIERGGQDAGPSDGQCSLHRSRRTTGAQSYRSTSREGLDPITADRTWAASAFVGRERELCLLRRAVSAVAAGVPVVRVMQGGSGNGKTALLQRFVAELRAEHADVVVLSGRCFERETVPFKGLDSIIHALIRHLRQTDDAAVVALLSEDLSALLRLFPALAGVRALASAAAPEPPVNDINELRRRAIMALCELLRRISEQSLLVVAIDDFQWSDSDSSTLLAELLCSPDAPALLLLLAQRPQAEQSFGASSPWSFDPAIPRSMDSAVVDIEPLEATTALTLAATALAPLDLSELAPAVAAEAAGNPFFINELARHLADQSQRAARSLSPEATISQVVMARVNELPEAARSLLQLVAISGRPVDHTFVCRAAGIASNARQTVDLLLSRNLIRCPADTGKIELYHDRIGDAVVRALPAADIQRLHLRLAVVLEGEATDAPEELAYHWHGAGEPARAAAHALQAADRSMEAFAFGTAARLYGSMLAMEATDLPPRQQLLDKLANALVAAGRSAEAAEAFLEAAALCEDGAQKHRLTLAAVEQLFQSEQIDRGLEAAKGVLRAFALDVWATSRRALISGLFRSVLLRLRGVGNRQCFTRDLKPEELHRIDALFLTSIGLVLKDDNVRAGALNAHCLASCLELGEPSRVIRALASQSFFWANMGWRHRHWCDELKAKAFTLATASAMAESRGHALLGAGMTDYVLGRWRSARDFCHQAEQVLRRDCVGVGREILEAQIHRLDALGHLGAWKEVARLVPSMLREAVERDDRALCFKLRTYSAPFMWLVAGNPERALEVLDEATTDLSTRSPLDHWRVFFVRVHVLHYLGHTSRAWQICRAQWRQLKRSSLLRFAAVRHSTMALLARTALSVAMEARSRSEVHRKARRELRSLTGRLQREQWPHCKAIAGALRAGSLLLARKPEAALKLMEKAESDFMSADMLLFAAYLRMRRGAILAGEQGRMLVSAGVQAFRDQGVVDPESMANMYGPSLVDFSPQWS